MRIEELELALKNLRASKESGVFNNAPQSHDEFQKRLGVWIGIGEALGLIEDMKRKEREDD